ncbi:hypothetical protein WICMUC_003514 [Wickerhamomyces mucosus]|uniref:UDP-galactose transporter homolog 1 n=1 Tax=Wickerhamomyces mucosus TaxID=1378264 RepID=A0A9P8TBS8_9ASCO|nr:hypothetical protein WICMUC_003514 [Wickerhamomyces mucosus]
MPSPSSLPLRDSSSVWQLILCIVGIYTTFLSWGILQEQLTKQTFDGEHFHFPLIINLSQSLFSSIVGFIYLKLSYKVSSESLDHKKISIFNPNLLKYISLVAITQSLSSPIGLSSVEHVDYLLYTLAKSCKLIPVMIVHILLYGKRFPLYKYLVATGVTFGVVLFTLTNSKNISTQLEHDNLPLGLLYLSVSLLLDGLTNATQDNLFKHYKQLTAAHLMVYLNFISFILTLTYSTIFSSQLNDSIQFITKYPIILKEIILYSVCGSIGQLFIFWTLAQFGSIVLITVTVTRKMISMLLSVFLFGHNLSIGQWVALILVFGGIGFEAFYKLKQNHIELKQKLK